MVCPQQPSSLLLLRLTPSYNSETSISQSPPVGQTDYPPQSQSFLFPQAACAGETLQQATTIRKRMRLRLSIYLRASNRLGSNRTTTYVIDPSILLNQCGVPAGMMTTSPAFIR